MPRSVMYEVQYEYQCNQTRIPHKIKLLNVRSSPSLSNNRCNTIVKPPEIGSGSAVVGESFGCQDPSSDFLLELEFFAQHKKAMQLRTEADQRAVSGENILYQ